MYPSGICTKGKFIYGELELFSIKQPQKMIEDETAAKLKFTCSCWAFQTVKKKFLALSKNCGFFKPTCLTCKSIDYLVMYQLWQLNHSFIQPSKPPKGLAVLQQ